ncbi:MAG: FAD-binding protein [Alphaproteobacteria bacterium]|nr:FAD-binding protein [Alphaproteobacteria bacterium]
MQKKNTPERMSQPWQNWGRGVTAHPARIAAPASDGDVQAVVREAPRPIRVTGSGHSFTPLCDTSGTLVSLDRLSGVVAIDKDAQTATIRAGTKIHQIGRPLYEAGLALKNQGDIDRQAIAGAVSTGTHGTGVTLGNFSSEVTALRLVSGSGDIISANRVDNPEIFEAGRLSLGALGILLDVTLSVRPRYKLKEASGLIAVDTLFSLLERLKSTHRHVEFFWFPYANQAVLKTLDETDETAPEPRTALQMASRGEAMSFEQRVFRGACEMVRAMPFLSGPIQRFLTRGMVEGRRVRWSHEAFPSPRNVRFNEMEYAVPAERAVDCIREIVSHVRKHRIATAFPFEFRFVKGDDVWLSPFYGRDSATIAVHQYYLHDRGPLFAAAEAIFKRYDGRPHWGKWHSRTGAEFAQLYPKWDDFLRVRQALDPGGVFLNNHLRAVFGLEDRR